MRTINGLELIPGVTKIFSCKFVDAGIDNVISCLIVAEDEDEASKKAIKIALTDSEINDNYELVQISLHQTGFYEEIDDEEEDPFYNICKDGYVLFEAESLS